MPNQMVTAPPTHATIVALFVFISMFRVSTPDLAMHRLPNATIRLPTRMMRMPNVAFISALFFAQRSV